MTTLRFKHLFLASGLAGVLIAAGGRSAQAESLQSTSQLNQASETTVAQTSPSDNSLTPNSTATTVAQAIDPGRATRSSSSYVGLGGNIGFTGGGGLGEGNFAVISKVGLTPNISVRPTALIGNNATFLVPATVDFPIEASVGRVGLAPYVGGGVSISTGNDSTVSPLITAGVDVPLGRQFTANASANVSFPDRTEVGVILGVGYNFR